MTVICKDALEFGVAAFCPASGRAAFRRNNRDAQNLYLHDYLTWGTGSA
jgi:hypothetical protein